MKTISSEMPVAEWLDLWLETYAKNLVSENTYHNYLWAIEKVNTVIPCTAKVGEMNQFLAQSLINEVYALGYAKSSIRKCRVVLKQAFQTATNNNLIVHNPCGYLSVPSTAPQKQVSALTKQEQKIVEEYCSQDMYGSWIYFLLYSGLRRVEFRHIQWDDVDFEKKVIRIKVSKTAKGIRTIPMTSLLELCILAQRKISAYVFTSTTGKPVTVSMMRRTYERIRRKTGIQKMTNHVCRHTYITRLLEAGGEAKAIADLVGHTSVKFMLDQYASVDLLFMRQQANLLDCSGAIACIQGVPTSQVTS